ncbi:MAG TPA: SPASM domain-containing protein, partial [Acidimicrobiales bacterium]|nr:SPASM domain-containing protein [Acidimicrobiales bacterium]
YRRHSRRLVELMGSSPDTGGSMGGLPPGHTRSAASAGTRDGKGIFFIAHDGWVFPAGFLPLRLGNVRQDSPVRIYREHPLLKAIRRAEFAGRCGRCQFRDICGGSRARAWAASMDPLGEDPACAYVPA